MARMTPEQVKSLPPPATRPVSFARDIQPIFEASCIKCHGRGRSKGEFQLDTRETVLKGGATGPAVVPGKSAESYLIELVAGVDPDNVMPQKGKRLTRGEISLLRAWIDQGLPWEAGVSLAKNPPRNLTPRRPELPLAAGEATHPVDRLLQAYLTAHQLPRPTPVEDRLFARRAYLDVIGLLPAAAELDAFVADRAPDKRARLVKRLLADRQRYAEHWLTFWNDLLRNDYRGTGYIDGGRKQITGWLYNALYHNLPYDRFVAELINPTPESEGFIKGILWRGAVNASQTPQMQAAQNISQVFMGVNLKCASCHDSFINDWTLADAYGLANIYSDEPLELYQCDKPTGKMASTRFIYPELGGIDAQAPKAERLKQLAALLTGPKDGRLSRTIVNRLWAKFFGRGLVEPLDDMEQPAWNADLLDWLAEDLVAHRYDLKHTIERILTSQAYQWPAVPALEREADAFVFRGPFVRRLSAEQFRDALGALTGVWYAQPAGNLNLPAPDGGERLAESARWIWSSPAAAQKAAPGTVYFRKQFKVATLPDEASAVVACDNSFTLYLNGARIASGKDFGKPVLVDLLAHLKSGDNLLAVAAHNHLPDNTRPAAGADIPESAANPAGFFFNARWHSRDGRVTELVSDNSWRWSAEKRDGWETPEFAAADWPPAGELGSADAAPWKLAAKLAQTLAAAGWKDQTRASLVAADSLLMALGRPNREQVTTTRPTAATTLQALELTNGETLSRLVKQGAARLQAEQPAATADQLVTELYRKALGRAPTGKESDLCRELVGQPVQREGLEDLLWSLAMLPEFQLIH